MRVKDSVYNKLISADREKIRLSAVPNSPYYDAVLIRYVHRVFCNRKALEYCLEFDEKAGWARCLCFDTSGRATNHAVEYRGDISLLIRQPSMQELNNARHSGSKVL
jgi:hypothetical protein